MTLNLLITWPFGRKFEQKFIWIFGLVCFISFVIWCLVCYSLENLLYCRIFNIKVFIQKITFSYKVKNLQVILIKERKVLNWIKMQKLFVHYIFCIFDHFSKYFINHLIGWLKFKITVLVSMLDKFLCGKVPNWNLFWWTVLFNPVLVEFQLNYFSEKVNCIL